MNRKDILNKKFDVELWINEQKSKAYICKQLSCKPSTLETYLKLWGINYSGNQGNRGSKSNKRISAMEYLNKETVSIPKLRRKLIEDGLKQEACEVCSITQWLGKKIPLELHHKDGNRFNNDISNLQIICPNCHSLTPNHSKKL